MSDKTDEPITILNLKRQMDQTWNELRDLLAHARPELLSQPKDAAGWTVKDHVVHLAVWQDGIRGLLEGRAFPETMGVDKTIWSQGETQINAAVQRRYQHLSPDEALDMLQRSHQQLMRKLDTLTDADLQRPYAHFFPTSQEQAPVIGWIVGNSYGHITEHLPWIKAILKGN